jgi:hypothetical protein
MERNNITEASGKRVMVAAVLFLTAMPSTTQAQDSALMIEIRTTQAVVKNNQDFAVNAKITNTGKEDQILHVSQCWHSGMQWASDNPSVHVKEIRCKENSLMGIRLKPGKVCCEWLAFPVRVSLTAGEPTTTSAVSFRLGFIEVGEGLTGPPDLAPASTAVPRIWSNVVTVTVAR